MKKLRTEFGWFLQALFVQRWGAVWLALIFVANILQAVLPKELGYSIGFLFGGFAAMVITLIRPHSERMRGFEFSLPTEEQMRAHMHGTGRVRMETHVSRQPDGSDVVMHRCSTCGQVPGAERKH